MWDTAALSLADGDEEGLSLSLLQCVCVCVRTLGYLFAGMPVQQNRDLSLHMHCAQTHTHTRTKTPFVYVFIQFLPFHEPLMLFLQRSLRVCARAWVCRVCVAVLIWVRVADGELGVRAGISGSGERGFRTHCSLPPHTSPSLQPRRTCPVTFSAPTLYY